MQWDIVNSLYYECFCYDRQINQNTINLGQLSQSQSQSQSNNYTNNSFQSFLYDFVEELISRKKLPSLSSSSSSPPSTTTTENENVPQNNPTALRKIPYTLDIVPLLTSETSMDFFSKITSSNEILTDDKRIRQCYEEEIDGVMVADELKKVLIEEKRHTITSLQDIKKVANNTDSEYFTNTQRYELMFAICVHLVVGGGLNQWSENWGDYDTMIRELYRELGTPVKKIKNTNGKHDTEPIINLISSASSVDTTSSHSSLALAAHLLNLPGFLSSLQSVKKEPAIAEFVIDLKCINRDSTIFTLSSSPSTVLKSFPFQRESRWNVCWLSINFINRTVKIYYFNYKSAM
jgi:hypothetical protein